MKLITIILAVLAINCVGAPDVGDNTTVLVEGVEVPRSCEGPAQHVAVLTAEARQAQIDAIEDPVRRERAQGAFDANFSLAWRQWVTDAMLSCAGVVLLPDGTPFPTAEGAWTEDEVACVLEAESLSELATCW